jgi:hypothetical protein
VARHGGLGFRRRSHLIRPDEVDAWLVDSVNKVVTYHRTLRAAAAHIVEEGIDLSRSRIGAYGQGFYTATDVSERPGEVDVTVAVRLPRPLEADALELDARIDAVVRQLAGPRGGLTPEVAALVRRVLLAEGYDGLVVRNAEGEGVDYVIALNASSVKVIEQ